MRRTDYTAKSAARELKNLLIAVPTRRVLDSKLPALPHASGVFV
jgi:hypothetical protein